MRKIILSFILCSIPCFIFSNISYLYAETNIKETQAVPSAQDTTTARIYVPLYEDAPIRRREAGLSEEEGGSGGAARGASRGVARGSSEREAKDNNQYGVLAVSGKGILKPDEIEALKAKNKPTDTLPDNWEPLPPLKRIEPFAPRHTGYTSLTQPVLYFYCPTLF